MWNPYFAQKVGKNYTYIEALPCKEVLKKHYGEEFANQIMTEVGLSEYYLCPDTEQFTLSLNTSSSLEFFVKLKPNGEAMM